MRNRSLIVVGSLLLVGALVASLLRLWPLLGICLALLLTLLILVELSVRRAVGKVLTRLLPFQTAAQESLTHLKKLEESLSQSLSGLGRLEQHLLDDERLRTETLQDLLDDTLMPKIQHQVVANSRLVREQIVQARRDVLRHVDKTSEASHLRAERELAVAVRGQISRTDAIFDVASKSAEAQEKIATLSVTSEESLGQVLGRLSGLEKLVVTKTASEESLGQVLGRLSELEKFVAEETARALKTRKRESQGLHLETLKAVWNQTAEVEALLQLFDVIEPVAPMPPLGRWALDANSMLHLISMCMETKPKLIVELGSGSSSVWLGYIARQLGAKVYSVEHLEEFREKTMRMVSEHSLDDVVKVVYAPLETTMIGSTEYRWYSQRVVGELPNNVDLLLVDGPPSGVGHLARYPALPVLRKKLARGGTVGLDDSDRPDERETLRLWQEEFPDFAQVGSAKSRITFLRRRLSESGGAKEL